MRKRNSPDRKKKRKKEKRSQDGMCKRKSPHKNEGSTGSVREAPHRKIKPALHV